MKNGNHEEYAMIVEWSNVDHCYVGSCPDLFYGGCHGNNKQQVFAELCKIVDETIELYHQDNKPFPRATNIKNDIHEMQYITDIFEATHAMQHNSTNIEEYALH
jgi:predicted RNase H-like HicB family nuclease